MTPDRLSILRRAIEYPYARPAGTFIFDPVHGTTSPVEPGTLGTLCKDRQAVLALGSNAAPEQLFRKFPKGEPVIVVAATLVDHDVVYAARITSYGAVPATIVSSAGLRCNVHITFLTEWQRDQMDRSEAVGTAYETVAVDNSYIDCPVPLLESPIAYRSLSGPLCIDDAPIALTAIEAQSRQFPSWKESEVLAWIAERCGSSLQELVLEIVNDSALRTSINKWLGSKACRCSGGTDKR